RGARAREERGSRAAQAPSASAGVHRQLRVPVRLLHAGHDHRREVAARREAAAEARRGAALDGRQHLPLHRLPDDRRRRARRGRRERRTPMRTERRVAGTEAKRADGIAKVTGAARFAIDLSVPAMAHAILIRSTRAHARIVSIDRAGAEGHRGVLKVITGDDLLKAGLTPYYGHVVLDHPMLYGYAMEPYNALAFFDQGDLVVYSTAQHVYMVRRDLARMFGLPLARVRVSAPYVGGGYGTKSYTKVEGACSMGAYFTGRPVKLDLSVEEAMLTTRSDASHIHARTAFDKNGMILARELDIVP